MITPDQRWRVPKPVVIDGKKGSAMWLDHPSELLKVVFDDGSVLFLKPSNESPTTSRPTVAK